MAIPLTGVNGSITITYTGNKTGHYYTYDDGNTGSVADRAQGGNNNDRTWTISDLESSDVTFYIGTSGKSITGITITTPTPATAPTITKQPEGGNYATGNVSPLTIEATASKGTLSFQWYSCNDANKTNATAIDGATNDSFTPTASGFYFCRVTDGNGSTDSDVVEVSISDAEAPTISVTPAAPSVPKNTSVTLTATVTGTPDPTIQWYSNTTATNSGGTAIEGETNTTYSPSTATPGTYYFYAVATNSEDTATSDVVTLTVTGSNACELTNIKFSNGAYGAIATLSEGTATVTVPYLNTESEPTVNESSIAISDGASYLLTGNTLKVTAEDGTTTGTYTITKTAYTPLAVTDDIATTNFSEVPSWIYCPYGYDAEKGVKFSKKVDEASNMRIAKGYARQYYFIAAAKTLTLTSGSAGARNIKVYRNGVQLENPTATAEKGKTISIALDESAPCMIMIESNQTGGDGGFTEYAVKAPTAVTLSPAKEYTTLTSAFNLDFTDVDGLKAYIVKDTDASDGVITMTQVNKVPAGTGLVVKKTGSAASFDVPVFDGTGADDVSGNKMEGSATATTPIAENGGYILSNGEFHPALEGDLPAGKAYLKITVTSNAPIMSFGDATAIDDVRSKMEDVRGDFYNLNGQRVAQPTKGLYIVNGKKVIMK